MDKRNLMLPFLLLMLAILFFGCEKEDDENETMISSFSSSESHNTGQNCINCHKQGGGGEGWFQVAGSVYDVALENPYTGATIKLSTLPQNTGNMVETIEADKKGNFYTTKSTSFADGLYVSVTGKTGTVHFMNSQVTTGQCNSCHNNQSTRIWAE